MAFSHMKTIALNKVFHLITVNMYLSRKGVDYVLSNRLTCSKSYNYLDHACGFSFEYLPSFFLIPSLFLLFVSPFDMHLFLLISLFSSLWLYLKVSLIALSQMLNKCNLLFGGNQSKSISEAPYLPDGKKSPS